MALKRKDEISPRLRALVHQSVAILGEVLERELGHKTFLEIEGLRSQMAKLRSKKSDLHNYSVVRKQLQKSLKFLGGITPQKRFEIAKSFTLMLELMNACENAYRSLAIRKRVSPNLKTPPDSILYVLTAHPTEARAPENIWIFHSILGQLIKILEKPEVTFSTAEKLALRHDLELAWRLPLVRGRKPQVRNEAEHIYSTLLRDETLRSLLACGRDTAPVYIRSWVGGDKDGHPGVDEKAFLQSLRLSRRGLVEFIERRIAEVLLSLKTLRAAGLESDLRKLLVSAKKLKSLKAGDGARILTFRKNCRQFLKDYEKSFGSLHGSLIDLKSLLHVFPALVVPLEFRESSDVLMSLPQKKTQAIEKMLQTLASVSRGTEPKWYVRGFIVSMTESLTHLQAAGHLVRRKLGAIKIPVIPLFEQFEALHQSSGIIKGVLADKQLASALKKHWENRIEIMLGYSDSSKESGVLLSRLEIAENMHKLDRLCVKAGDTPLFFQGSGGSIARGGGSIPEQTAWWSGSALRNYKVTIQGEMVERSLANPEITRGQIERIATCASRWPSVKRNALPHIPEIDVFARRVADHYKKSISDPDFLKVVEYATPYPFLNLIKFGSRPNKRAKKLSVSGLRAIPWILCWTQTRTLIPSWWGVGQAWASCSAREKKVLIRQAKVHPLFSSYVKIVGLTLAKIEPEIFRIYLEKSGLAQSLTDKCFEEFMKERRLALDFSKKMLGTKHLLPSKEWLAESIQLRSPMIHPLNLLQVLAMQKREADLLRVSVAGIASGMLATG